jgi:hypothetical protein
MDDLLRDLDVLGRDDGMPICKRAAARIRELEAQLAAPAVKVTPLVWEWSDRLQGWRADCELTRDVFVAYQSGEKWCVGSQYFVSTFHQTSDAGKSHLDQMRDACILSTIKAVPVAEVWRRAMEAAAQVVECGCGEDEKARAVAAEAPNGGPRWMACGEANCGAIDAATIRALPMPDDLPTRPSL